MPIKHSRTSFKPHCTGSRWEIIDEQQLTEAVAQLALGQHRHVWQVLQQIGPGSHATTTDPAIDSVIQKLRNKAGGNLYNRDGWLFQLISWIALAVKSDAHTVIDAPHTQPAQKQCDGLCIQLSAEHDKIKYVVISEDKATDSPRDTFLQQVLPEIRDIVAGGRDTELLSRLTTLIERSAATEQSCEAMLAHAHWKPKLRFRACICTSEAHLPPQVNLFDGFEEAVDGSLNRRRGELLLDDDFREWLDSFAENVITYLEELRGAS